MTVREILDEVRTEFEAMSFAALVQVAIESRVDVTGLTKAQVIDALMGIEEHAAFH